MRRWMRLAPATVAAIILCSTACELPEPESTYDGPVVPDISGDWKGCYFFNEFSGGGQGLSKACSRGRPLTASVMFNETDHTYVTVTTSLAGRGHHFSGRIDEAGNMRVTDSYDGELWSTYHRRATPALVEINDIVWAGEIRQGQDAGLRNIVLNERVAGSSQEEAGGGYSPGNEGSDSNRFVLWP